MGINLGRRLRQLAATNPTSDRGVVVARRALPALRSNGMAVLPPSMAQWRPPITDFARALRDDGRFSAVGRIGGFDDNEGTTQTQVKIRVPKMTEGASGGLVTFPTDLEAARYLMPRTRVRLTLEILADNEDE